MLATWTPGAVFILAAGLILSGCTAGDPITFDNDTANEQDNVVSLPGSPDFNLLSHKDDDNVILNESADDVVTIVVEALAKESATLDGLKVVWCDNYTANGTINIRRLCTDSAECNLHGVVEGDLKRESRLTISGLELGTEDDVALKHKIEARLVSKDADDAKTCQDKLGKTRQINVLVQQVVEAPITKIVPPNDGPCHTRADKLRAKIDTLPGFEKGTYRLRWYRDNTDSANLLKDLFIQASGQTVCTGNESDISSPCVLETAKFKKNDTIILTAQITNNGQESVNGQETLNPAKAVICDAWPVCNGFAIGLEPSGVSGTLRCSAQCQDADSDPVSAEVRFINVSQSGKDLVMLTPTPVPPDAQGQSVVNVELDLKQATNFAIKGDILRCEMYPFGTEQVQWKTDDDYPYAGSKDNALKTGKLPSESGLVSVKNTPPSVNKPIILPQVSPKTVLNSYTCDISGKVSDADIADTQFNLKVEWYKQSGEIVLTQIDGVFNLKSNPQTSVAQTAFVPVTAGEITKGDSLCCRVTVTEKSEIYPLNVTPPFSESCVQLDNTTPTFDQETPTVTIAEANVAPSPDSCGPGGVKPSTPGVYYTWQALECKVNAKVIDPDDAPENTYVKYNWFDCGTSAGADPLYVSNDAIAPAGALPKGKKLCCEAIPCDLDGCSTTVATMDKANAVFLENSPPVATKPQIVPSAPSPSGDKNGTFLCSADVKDCDDPTNALNKNVFWWKKIPGGALSPLGDIPGKEISSFSGLSCQDQLVCQVKVSDGGPYQESPQSEPFVLNNSYPSVDQVQVIGPGTVTLTSTLTCDWKGLQDNNGDSIQSVYVQWYADGKAIQSEPQKLPSANISANGSVDFKLGECGGKKNVEIGQTIHCEVWACDGCGCGTPTSSASPPFVSTKTVVANPAPVSLLPNTQLAILSPESGDKTGGFTCALNTKALAVCDTDDLQSFQYIYQLKAAGATIANAEEDAIGGFQKTFTFSSCPDATSFWCQVTIVGTGGNKLLTGSSNLATIDEHPPTVTTTISATSAKVGEKITCSASATDKDPEDVPKLAPLYRWYKFEEEMLQYQGLATITLESGVFTAGDSIRCSGEVSDGCFDTVLAKSDKTIIVNSPPTLTSVLLSPDDPKAVSQVECTASGYVDADGHAKKKVSFVWETSQSSTMGWTAIPTGDPCVKEVALQDKSVLYLSQCAIPILKGTFVRCKATALDEETSKTPSSGIALTSNVVKVQDSIPYLDPIVMTANGTLPSSPSLDPGQGSISCVTAAHDDDPNDKPTVLYTWKVIGTDNKEKGTIQDSVNSTLDVTKVFTGGASPAPCDSIQCVATLKNELGQIVTTATKSIGMKSGGSLYFSETGGSVNVTPEYPAGTEKPNPKPTSGLLELWYYPEVLPGGLNQHTIVMGRSAAGYPAAWELVLRSGGVVDLVVNGVLQGPGSQSLSVIPKQWQYLAIQWEPGTTTLYVGDNKATALPLNVTLPFDMEKVTFGSLITPPRGWLDELRVSNQKLNPSVKEQWFTVSTSTLAVYHFELAKAKVPVDSGKYQFHGVLANPAPTAAFHAQSNICDFEVSGCDPVTNPGSCTLPPGTVTLSFDGSAIPTGTAKSTYQAKCLASGAVDLNGGPVTQYQFTFRNVDTGAALNTTTLIGSGSYTFPIDVGVGCLSIVCEAAPIPIGGGAPGKIGTSQQAKLCKSTEFPIIGFNCDDGNTCTTDGFDVKGCTHEVSPNATCSAVCTPGKVSQCGTDKLCSCINPCVQDPKQPCVEYLPTGPNGACQAQNKPPGAECYPVDLCAASGAKGQCVNGACAQYALKDCNDSNVCTEEYCDSTKGCVGFNNTKPCSDGNACTAGDVCKNGDCLSGGQIVCDDGNSCTEDSCNENAPAPELACSYVIKDGAGCTDGNPCTTNDHCVANECTGTPQSCNDDNPCTDDSCDPLSGCIQQPNAKPCNDGDACTTTDTCTGGQCKGAQVTCNDNNVCTDDSCNKASGCVFSGNTKECSDGNACTTGDKCNATAKACVGNPISCDDGQLCTTDSCKAASGCQNLANVLPCTDGNACTIGDVCKDNKCSPGNLTDCNDGNPCTVDSCDKVVGCEHLPSAGGCDDGNACTISDYCQNSICVPGASKNCDAGNTNVCLASTCTPDGGCGALEPVQGTKACNDGDACTTNDLCALGQCKGTAISCEDGNVCTDDSCSKTLGCVNGANTKACNDNNPCTVTDVCANKICAGVGTVCDDGKPCTTDTCDPKNNGCIFTETPGANCEDGDKCTLNDKCVGSVCTGGTAPNCNDNNPCTADSCSKTTGCVNTPIAGSACTDNNACTLGDACNNVGVCVAGNALVCNDGETCTTDTCNPQSGCVYTNNALSCQDGDACTENDICAAGKCKGGTFKSCNDNNNCTNDVCDKISGCVFSPNTLACNDNDVCTEGDACSNGTCKPGAPKICNDNNPCTINSCDKVTGCKYSPEPSKLCDDSNDCTVNDVCDTEGVCVGETLFCCELANAQTTCNYSYIGTVSGPVSTTYGGNCNATSAGGRNFECLPQVTGAELCIDIDKGGNVYLLSDVATLPAPDTCQAVIANKACTAIPALPADTVSWLASVHVTNGTSDARLHVRCPTTDLCAAGKLLECNKAFTCTGTWQNAVSNYGTCATGKSSPERTFKATISNAGPHTFWISGAETPNMTVFATKSLTGNCTATEAATCSAVGPANTPLHFVTAGANEVWCFYVEQDAILGNVPVSVSVSCYSALK
ncbi:MAG: hypothetical protein HUU55_07020 [Myxococcales bacterium]|nr:hypothetical protein [Myxococcales bacterium]